MVLQADLIAGEGLPIGPLHDDRAVARVGVQVGMEALEIEGAIVNQLVGAGGDLLKGVVIAVDVLRAVAGTPAVRALQLVESAGAVVGEAVALIGDAGAVVVGIE